MAPAPDGPATRRSFLGRIAGILGGAIALVLSGTGLSTFVSPAFGRRDSGWIKVGEVDPDRIRGVRSMIVTYRKKDGWYTGSGQALVHLTKGDDDALVALSSVCTHLGCSVSWDAKGESFHCPCHGGAYDASGRVTAGPPPRPLDRLETRWEEGVLFVRGGGLGA